MKIFTRLSLLSGGLLLLLLPLGFSLPDTRPPASDPDSMPIPPQMLSQVTLIPDRFSNPDSSSSASQTITLASNDTPVDTTPPISIRPMLPTSEAVPPSLLLISLLVLLLSLAGVLLYLCGLSKAKNCGHTVTLVLVGTIAAFLGFWTSGFALISGGLGDDHAGPGLWVRTDGLHDALNHELGINLSPSIFLGVMGNSGFFVSSSNGASGVSGLFLVQMSLFMLGIGGILGAGLERARLMPMSMCMFALMAFIIPTLGNWVWGGGWLAQLGTCGWGRGTFDLAGASVVHESAGACALALALVLGTRQSGAVPEVLRQRKPGHNVPFFILGTVLCLGALLGSNVLGASLASDGTGKQADVAALNTLLASCGGLLASFILLWKQERGVSNPFRLSQGLLGGAVSVSACAGWYEGPIALFIGFVGGLLVGLFEQVLRRTIRWDDPASTVSVQGVAGFWAMIAAGLFANPDPGSLLGGTGLIYSGLAPQLADQAVGALVVGLASFLPALATFWIIDLAVGLRVDPSEEVSGLDSTQIGTAGYQADVD